MNKKLKVALYVRVSSQEQATEGYSIGEQEIRLKKYAEAMNWDIYKVYIDPGYSGGDTNRPALKSMIRDIESGEIDKVVVYKLDRLSRSQLDTLYLIEKIFLANNTDFVSMSENFDTATSFGRAMIGILAVFAQLEREQIKERMTMGKEARAKEGKWNGGTEPIGYDYNIADDMLYPNEYEQLQIRELRELFLQGVSLRAIETQFKNKGYIHKHGPWDPKAMRRVLRSKIYLGYLNYKGVWYPAEHEKTLDEDTYNKIIKLLDARHEQYKKLGIKPGVITTYLGGLLYCKQCGAKYSKDRQSTRKHDGALLYTCNSRNKKVKKMIKDPNCKNKRWKLNELDSIVLGEINKLALDPNYFIKNAQKDKINKTEADNKINVLKKEINKIDEQISRFMDLYGIGKFSIEQVSNKVESLNEQKKHLEKEIKNLTVSTGALTTEETLTIVESINDILDNGDFNEIRHLIESLIYYIELDNDDVYIHWKFA